MQVAELYISQFLPDPKTDLAFPLLSVIFHPYLSFQPQSWLQLFCITKHNFLSDLSSRSSISRGPGTAPYLIPGCMNLLRHIERHLQNLLSASGTELWNFAVKSNMAGRMQCLLAMSLTASLISIRPMICWRDVWFEDPSMVSALLCCILWVRASTFGSNLELSASLSIVPCEYNPHFPESTEN